MGDGEGYRYDWFEWWKECNFSEEERIAYIKKWPPPHCWLEWTIDAIWEVEMNYEFDALHEPYYKRLEELGFGSMADCESDLNDPKWH